MVEQTMESLKFTMDAIQVTIKVNAKELYTLKKKVALLEEKVSKLK